MEVKGHAYVNVHAYAYVMLLCYFVYAGAENSQLVAIAGQ